MSRRESRRRKRGFRYKLRRFMSGLRESLYYAYKKARNFFRKALPRRRPGEPVWKSRRLIAGAVAGLLCVGIVMICIFAGGGKTAEKKALDAEPVAETAAVVSAAEPTPVPDPVNLFEGCPDDAKIYELQERLTEIGYLDSDEFTEHFGPSTTQSVIRYQILNGFEADGKVNNVVWDHIFGETHAEYILQIGMEGSDIEDLQDRLRDLGYLSSSPTGYYGTDTEQALKTFQEKHGLAVSGKIDEATSEKLYSEDVISLFFKKGDESDEIKKLQERLKELGYITFEPDGIYGNGTLAAVKQFQNKNGLTTDGYIGYQTKELLLSSNAKKNILSDGDEGDAVTKLQNRLVKLGYINKATGYYGSDTVKAVKNFQNQHGLSADGMAGVNTLNKLYASDAQKAKTTVKVGQSSKINNFIAKAKSKLGCRYVLGAKGPNKFDCSGLVYWCLNQVGVKQGYMTSVRWRTGGNYKTIKNINEVRAGDILCFTPHHCAIAISGDTMIDASSANGKVVQRSFKTSYWKKNFVCARRIFN